MKLRICDPRILAIDFRHRRFGFAIFEGHRSLLGCGVRVYPATGEEEIAMMSKRLSSLIEMYKPSAIVTMQERWAGAGTSIGLLEEELLRVAARHCILIEALANSQVQQSFVNLGCSTKYQIATSLSRIYPELSYKLPPARRIWESEHSSMIVFNAVALGMSYWQQDRMSIFEPEEQPA